jgi:predicted amidohydrolase
MSSPTVRLAAAQVTPAFLDLDASIAKAESVIHEAGRNGAQLVAFPETWLPGYPMWVYGSAGWNDAAAKRAFARLKENALQLGSPQLASLCEAANRNGVMVVIGANELDVEYSRGTLFNSLVYISPDGQLMGVHRKLMPTHAEKLIWGAGDGSTLHVFDAPIGRVGGLICWEHWMPLARYAMHAKAEQIHVAAWPEVPDIHHLASRHYAFEGRCVVICVGSYMRMSDIPDNFELKGILDDAGQFADDADELLPGGSGIIGPDAQWIAGPVAGREELIYADVDLSLCAGEQLAFDAAGHYNRPDVFHLQVDTRPRRQIEWLGEEALSPGASSRPHENGGVTPTVSSARAPQPDYFPRINEPG